MPERGDAKPEWGFQWHDLENVAQKRIYWCWLGGAISTSGCSRFINHGAVTFLAVLRKNGMHYWELSRILRATRRSLNSQEGWSQDWWEAEIEEKNFEKDKERFWRESSGSRGPNLWTWCFLTTNPVSDMSFVCFWSSNFVLFGGVRLTPCTTSCACAYCAPQSIHWKVALLTGSRIVNCRRNKVIRILAPPFNPAFFSLDTRKKQRPKKSLLFHQTQNKALQDFWWVSEKKKNWDESAPQRLALKKKSKSKSWLSSQLWWPSSEKQKEMNWHEIKMLQKKTEMAKKLKSNSWLSSHFWWPGREKKMNWQEKNLNWWKCYEKSKCWHGSNRKMLRRKINWH